MNKKKKTNVKVVQGKLRESLKDPAFRADYMEKQRLLKLASKLAAQRVVAKKKG